MTRLTVRIEGFNPPGTSCGPSPDEPGGYHNIHVGIQRRNKRDEWIGLTSGDDPAPMWVLECTATPTDRGVDVRGPYVQGPPAGRFIYLSWVHGGDDRFRLFRRAKLWFDGVTADVMAEAVECEVLTGRLGLTDSKGNPTCTAGRPPTITWSAGAGR